MINRSDSVLYKCFESEVINLAVREQTGVFAESETVERSATKKAFGAQKKPSVPL